MRNPMLLVRWRKLSRRESTQRLASLFKKSSALLKTHLDVYAAILKYSQANFYQGHRLTREVDAPPRHTPSRARNARRPAAARRKRVGKRSKR